MHIKALEDRLLQYIPLQVATHCLTHKLKKQATQYGFHSLTPTQQNLLRSFFQCACEKCQAPLKKEALLEAYEAKEKLNYLLCENCRTVLQIMG